MADFFDQVEKWMQGLSDPLLDEAWQEACDADARKGGSWNRMRVADFYTRGGWARERKRRLRRKEMEASRRSPAAREHALSRPIGKRVRAERVLAGLTASGLANVTGMTANAIERIERGERRITLEEAFWIADALQLPVVAFRPPR